jgi:hypothetical protein
VATSLNEEDGETFVPFFNSQSILLEEQRREWVRRQERQIRKRTATTLIPGVSIVARWKLERLERLERHSILAASIFGLLRGEKRRS